MLIDKKTKTILAVERTISDLRRGFPVVITDGEQKLLAIAAENACESVLSAFSPARLVLTAKRLDAIAPEQQHDKPAALQLHNTKTLADICGSTGNIPSVPSASLTEASRLELSALQLVKLAQLLPAVVTCELETSFNDPQYLYVDAQDIAIYKDTIALELTEVCRTPLVLKDARDAQIIAFRPNIGGQEHYAIVIGDINDSPLVRVHSSCYTGDLLDSLACDCRDQLHSAIARMAQEGGGIILYMMQEGRDIGLINKLRAYALKAQGHDTVDANEILGFEDDERLFLPAVEILKKLNIKSVRLLTNNPRKAAGLTQHGIGVRECVPHIMESHEHNEDYLKTKAERLGHKL